jgi:hypothetical protein
VVLLSQSAVVLLYLLRCCSRGDAKN